MTFAAWNAESGLARQGAEEADAVIRVVHAVAGAGPLDVYVDGAIALIGVAFGDASADLTLAPGDHRLAVVPSGSPPEAAIVDGPIALDGSVRSYAVLLGTADEASVGLYAIDDRPVDAGRARFRIVSGVPDVAEITPAFAGGDALSEPLGFGDASQYAAIDAGSYDLEMLDDATGAPLVSLPQTSLGEGTATDIFLAGQASDGSIQAFVTSIPLGAAPVAGQFAQLHSGTCDSLGPVVADLGVVQVGQGDTVGIEDTAPVAQGYGLAPVPFETLTDTPHAVAVFASSDQDQDGAALACGEIGGPLTDTGALVIALAPVAAGGPDGVAVLAPSLENPDATGISIFLTGLAPVGSASGSDAVTEEAAD